MTATTVSNVQLRTTVTTVKFVPNNKAKSVTATCRDFADCPITVAKTAGKRFVAVYGKKGDKSIGANSAEKAFARAAYRAWH